jgi:branched-chain amino acid transport system substrate-binding protein
VKLGACNFNQLALATIFAGAIIGCNGGGSASNGSDETSTVPTGEPNAKRPAPSAEGFKVDGDTIKIACVASVSGDQKPWGDDQYDGAKLAVDEVNKAGGIQGKKVELILGDSGSKQDQAKTAAEKVLGEKVIGIVGEVSSGNTIQIAKSAFDKGVPVIAVGATRTDLTDNGANVWRVCYTDAFQGPVMAKFAYDKLGLRKVAVMTDNNLPYSQGLSKSFIDKFKQLGGEIVTEAFYESGGKQAPDYSSQLTEIGAKSPDGLFCSGYFPEVGPLAQQAVKAGLKVKFLGGDGWDSDQLLTSGGNAILGGFFCNHYNNLDTRPQVQDFLTKWKATHGGKEPATTMGALGYDATALLLDALKRAKTLDSKGLMAAIEETENYKAVSGDITLKGKGGNPDKRAIVVEVTPKSGANWQKFAIDYTPDQIK